MLRAARTPCTQAPLLSIMNQRMSDLHVFLEALRYETEALAAMSDQLRNPAVLEHAYQTVMDAYAQLRNLRASLTETFEAPRHEVQVHSSEHGL